MAPVQKFIGPSRPTWKSITHSLGVFATPFRLPVDLSSWKLARAEEVCIDLGCPDCGSEVSHQLAYVVLTSSGSEA
jgi:hypothetical protein